MTDEERLAVAITRMRIMGVHPTWVEFVLEMHANDPYDDSGRRPWFIERFVDELAEASSLMGFDKPRYI